NKMKHDKLIKILFKTLILFLILPILFGTLLFSIFFKNVLRRALKEKGRDDVIRLLSYKGLFGVFDLIERRRQR
ncbi:MAG: hypothetical protein ACFFD2_19790, partial [Promethearchaeota archaeon]